jgi:hypothetical protein
MARHPERRIFVVGTRAWWSALSYYSHHQFDVAGRHIGSSRPP